MPNGQPLIPPFSAEGSSSPAERRLHPSTLEQILEAVAVALGGFGGGLQGNPLVGTQLAQGFQEQRRGLAQNELANRLLGLGVQLGRTPEQTDFNIPSLNLGGTAQTLPTSVPTQNPAYQDLIDKILRGSQQFAQLGGDPNVLAGVLGKAGLLQTPQERVAAKREEADLKQQEADRKLKIEALAETKRRNLILEGIAKERSETYKSSVKARNAFLKQGGTPKDRVGQAEEIISRVARMRQLLGDEVENKNFLRQATNQVLLPEPTQDDAIRAAGFTTQLYQKAQEVLAAGFGIKPEGGTNGKKDSKKAARFKELDAKIDAGRATLPEINEYEKLANEGYGL